MSFEHDLQTDAVALAKKYSFFPGNAAQGFMLNTDVKAKPLKGDFEGFKRSHVKDDKVIARVTLTLGLTDRGECLKVGPKLGGDSGVPVYFLPWDAKGAAVRMTIPDADPALPEDQHPKIFFTAVLSGCSIIFKGSPQNPTIYHCGTEGGDAGTPTPSDTTKFSNSNDFFRKMLSGHGYRPIGAQISSNDYMIPKRSPAGSEAVSEAEQHFLDALKQQPQFQKGFILKSEILGVPALACEKDGTGSSSFRITAYLPMTPTNGNL